MRKGQFFLILALVSTAVAIQSCVVAAVGAGMGTVAYVMGDLEVVEAKDIGTVYEATEKALEQLELNVTKKAKDATAAVIVARDAMDKKIKIRLSAKPDKITKLSIRVGMFGNEAKSRLIYDQIKKNLR